MITHELTLGPMSEVLLLTPKSTATEDLIYPKENIEA